MSFPYLGGFPVGGLGLPSSVLSDPPSVVITAPTGTITSATPTVEFTYTSAIGRTQVYYRYVVEVEGGGIVYDSGPIEGDDEEFVLGFSLTAFVPYFIHVGVSDGLAGG
jgi:hypothetical protein